MTLTKSELLAMITRYKSGAEVGQPTNEALREVEHLLTHYSYNEHELKILKAAIDAATPPRIFKKRRKEAELGT